MTEVQRNRQIVRDLWENLGRKPTVAEMAEAIAAVRPTDFLQTQQAAVEARFTVGEPVTISLPTGRGSRKVGKVAKVLRLAPEGFLTVEGKNGQEVQIEARFCTPLCDAALVPWREAVADGRCGRCGLENCICGSFAEVA